MDFFHNSVFFKKKADNSLKKSKVEWHWYKFFILSLHLQFIDCWFHRFKTLFLYRFISMFSFSKTKIKTTHEWHFSSDFKTNPCTYFWMLGMITKHGLSLQPVWSRFRTIFLIQNLMYLYRSYTAEGNTFRTTCGEASLTIIIT